MATIQSDSKNALVVNPENFAKIKKLGAFDVTACFSCGQCTVSCPLSVSGNEFPRKLIRYAMLGLNDKLLSQPEPWLCYYCGDCSESCPSQADPGGFMMAVRRHAIIEYSVGKVAKFFYEKLPAMFAYLVLTLFAIAAIWFFSNGLDFNHVDLDRFDSYSFVHEEAIHIVGTALALFIFTIALIQAVNIIRHLAKNGQTPPNMPLSEKIFAIIKSFIKTGIFEGIFEKRFYDCDSKARYIAHMTIFWGFVFMGVSTSIIFIIDVILFYNLLGPTTETIIDRDIFKLIGKILGVVGGILLIYGTGYYIIKRLIKDDDYSKNSHFSDWIFLLLAFFLGITGFIMNLFIFILIDMLIFAYVMYAIHIILAFLLVITATFTKFVHMEYRLLSVWFNEYQRIVNPPVET
ncbi:MAG: 4Fe-4S dicluster domain-containing protein [Candidatus Hodarchaeota archaeon]